eukprot:RCo032190
MAGLLSGPLGALRISWDPRGSALSAEADSASVSSSLGKLSTVSLPSSAVLPLSSGYLQVTGLRVTFTAPSVRRHLHRSLRVALCLDGRPSQAVHSRKVRAELRGGLASTSWAGER